MHVPALPQNETERLAALYELNLLDTPAEERFDRITRMARRLFDVPIAVVTLLDEERQWFKSKIGIQSMSTAREISFCGHTILGDSIFIVEDTHQDRRFSDNPLVTDDPKIRFYAGYPLSTLTGLHVGALCVIDRLPRHFDAADEVLLRDLAMMIEHELNALQLAMTDELTKISNRRGFISLSRCALDWCVQHDRHACMLYLDLNNFKAVNDGYGHAEGDRCLQIFADALRHCFDHGEAFGRLGGDEFAVLFSDCDLSNIEQLLQDFTHYLNDCVRDLKRPYTIEFAVGYALFNPQQPQSVDELLTQADQQMYQFKNNH